MPGTNAGTGQPINFQCSACRRRRRWPCGAKTHVRLTGRKKKLDDGNARGRSTKWSREYICRDCGHKGWSRHIDLQDIDIDFTELFSVGDCIRVEADGGPPRILDGGSSVILTVAEPGMYCVTAVTKDSISIKRRMLFA